MSLTVDPCWCNSIYHPLPKLISTRTDVWPATFGLWWNTVWENGFWGSARNWAEDSQVHGKGPYGWVSGCQLMTPASLLIQLWVWPLLWQLLPSWPSTNTAPRPLPPGDLAATPVQDREPLSPSLRLCSWSYQPETRGSFHSVGQKLAGV